MQEEKKILITHVEVYTSYDVELVQYNDRENGLDVSLSSMGALRYSVNGQRLTIESFDKPQPWDTKLSDYRLDVKSISVFGKGSLEIDTDIMHAYVTMKIYNAGNIHLKDSDKNVFRRINIFNHDSGRILGGGTRTEELKIRNTHAGQISGFVVERYTKILNSGPGTISLDKFSNCQVYTKLGSSSGKVSFLT